MNAVAKGKQATKLPRIIVRRARNYILNRAFRAIFLILIRVLQKAYYDWYLNHTEAN